MKPYDPEEEHKLHLEIERKLLAGTAASHIGAIAAEAQFQVAIMYREGYGALQDNVQAYLWFNLSIAEGNSAAIKERDEIAAKMTQEQIAKAQQLTQEWRDRHRRD